jgi:hypothetical protein
MNSATYISQYHEDYIDHLKMGLLYFDELEIPLYTQRLGRRIGPGSTPKMHRIVVYDQNYFISDDFKANLEFLIQERVVSYKVIDYEGIRNGEIVDSIDKRNNKIEKFVLENVEMFYKNVTITRDEENTLNYIGDLVDELIPFEAFLKQSKSGSPGLLRYASTQLTTFVNALSNNETCLITGDFLHNLLSSYLSSRRFNDFSNKMKLKKAIDASIAFNAIKLAIPNISRLSFEQILDLRFKLNDELTAFKMEVERIILELEFNMPLVEIYIKSDEIVKIKIQPILNDLINKMKSIVIYKDLLDNIKDPKSYSPLLLSLTNNLSNTQILLSSLGLISLSTALNFYEKNRELQANGHYYLLKLNKLK